MNVSMNELKMALRRCFEAHGYYWGNFEDAAAMILWLEQNGLNGLLEFKKSIPYLNIDSNLPFNSVIDADQKIISVNCHGRSAFNCASSIIDFANTKVFESGEITIILQNCHNRIFILKALSDCAIRGLNISASWVTDSKLRKKILVKFKPGSMYPDIEETNLDDKQDVNIEEQQSLNIHLKVPESFELEKIIPVKKELQINSFNFNALQNGITIDSQLWNEINQLGLGVLVEDSVNSRQGAGV